MGCLARACAEEQERVMNRMAISVVVATWALGCGGNDAKLTNSGPGNGSTDSGTPPQDGGLPPTCSNDCDCATGMKCQPAVGEAPAECVPGQNTCPIQCSPACGPYQQCNTSTGTCVNLTCPSQIMCGTGYFCGPNGTCLPDSSEPSVDGQWKTYYAMDVSQFAQNANIVLTILQLLDAILTGQANCNDLSTSYGQILCYIFDLVGAQVQAPSWVNQLLTTLQDLFQFGSMPVTANGTMNLTQGANNSLGGTETWSTLYVEYNGQVLDLMNNPVLGSSGNVSVTIPAFGGTRDETNVYLGSRDVNLDVDKFIIALIDVLINAATSGQATDIGGLLDLLICDQLTSLSQEAACLIAVSALTSNITVDSGLGGFTFSHQNAPIIVPAGSNVASGLGTQAAPGSLVGSMTNGIISGDLGPTSSWYGTR
jgi:hypothetical protein